MNAEPLYSSSYSWLLVSRVPRVIGLNILYPYRLLWTLCLRFDLLKFCGPFKPVAMDWLSTNYSRLLAFIFIFFYLNFNYFRIF